MLSSEISVALEPIGPDAPCGIDLEDSSKYDPAFAELERLVQGKAEQQIGSTVVAAEEPDWKLVQRKSVAILARSKDLRVATHLARSLLRTEGWSGFASGLAVLHGLVERYWDGMYPRLDPEDGNDPTMRVNILMSITDSAFLAAVRATPLIVSRTLGRFSLKDIDIAAGEAAPETNGGASPATATSIEAAAMDCDLTVLQATASAVGECVSTLAALETAVASRVDAANAPSFAKLTAVIHKAGTFLGSKVAERMPPDATGTGGNGVGGGEKEAGAWTGGIKSRQDVLRALDGISAYYEKHEPSSPIPIFMARCKRLVMMGFVDIVKELVPDALRQIEVLGGRGE